MTAKTWTYALLPALLLLTAPGLRADDDPLTRFDTDGDGGLDQAELVAAHQELGKSGQSDELVAKILARFDVDGDGRLSGAEISDLKEAIARRKGRRRNGAAPSNDRDLLYVEGGDRRHQTLDLYVPPGAEGLPVVVFVHGGGWSKGDKSGAAEMARFYNERGVVFVSINYRLSPAVTHPAHVEDVAAALAWVERNIADHGGDPERIGIAGHSAGAHLVALVATNEEYLAAHGLDLSVIRAVVPIDFGFYDMAEFVRLVPRFATAFPRDEEGLRSASPLLHVEAGKGIPDFLFLKAGREAAKAEHMEEMRSALEEAGVDAEIVSAPSKTHGSINRDIGRVDDHVSRAVTEFFAARLGQVQSTGE